MIRFLVCRGYGFTMRPLQRDAKAPKCVAVPYDKVLREDELPRATYVFTDIDRLSGADRVAAGRLFRKLTAAGCRVLNDPGRVSTRLPLLRKLHRSGLNSFNVYTLDEADAPMRFPVFLRVADDHEGPLTDLIPDHETLKRAIEALNVLGYPPSTLMIIEYAAEPIGGEIFRKLSVFRVGDRFLPHPCVHDVNWTIKQGRTGVATSKLYDEELEIIRTNPFAEQMKQVFEIAGTEFGRVDFSLVNGRPCIYEINTNPTLAEPTPHPVPQRVESRKLWWDGFLQALHAIDEPDVGRPPVNVSGENPTILGGAIETYPAIRNGLLKLAEALSRSGDGEAAIRHAELALGEGRDDASVVMRVSRIMADNDRLSEAIDIVDHAMASSGESFELLLHAGRLLARAGRAEAAVDAGTRAIALKPDDPRGYEALYGIQWSLGDFAAALKTVGSAAGRFGEVKGPAAARRLKQLREHRRALRGALLRQRVGNLLRRLWVLKP